MQQCEVMGPHYNNGQVAQAVSDTVVPVDTLASKPPSFLAHRKSVTMTFHILYQSIPDYAILELETMTIVHECVCVHLL